MLRPQTCLSEGELGGSEVFEGSAGGLEERDLVVAGAPRVTARHQVGESLAGRVVTMAVGRGSSSASTVLAEAIRLGTGPAALIMREPDEIVNLGAIVADELYGITMPILIVDEPTFIAIAAAERATISPSGTLTF